LKHLSTSPSGSGNNGGNKNGDGDGDGGGGGVLGDGGDSCMAGKWPFMGRSWLKRYILASFCHCDGASWLTESVMIHGNFFILFGWLNRLKTLVLRSYWLALWCEPLSLGNDLHNSAMLNGRSLNVRSAHTAGMASQSLTRGTDRKLTPESRPVARRPGPALWPTNLNHHPGHK
jgi:hypothetical protein